MTPCPEVVKIIDTFALFLTDFGFSPMDAFLLFIKCRIFVAAKNESVIDDMKKALCFAFCILCGLLAQAQEQFTVEQNLEDYDYAVKYVEDNYAGFPSKVVDANRTDYEALKARLRTQVVSGDRTGWDAAAEYLAWFNDRHLKIHYAVYNEKNENVNWTEQYWKKKSIHYEGVMEYAPVAMACKVTDKTFLIRFPACSGPHPDAKWIKNSIKQFKKSHCENLVIDIRGNMGGDPRWSPYGDLLYDHEGTLPGVEYRNTQDNINFYLEYERVNKVKGGIAKSLKDLSARNPDSEFISLSGDEQLIRNKKVDKSVKKAAIIIDNSNASNTEAMLLEIMATSYRTTVYGRDNTEGCLDFSNVSYVQFKHFDHVFSVPTSRRIGLPETGIDDTGIAPDVRIPLPLPAKLTDNIDEWVFWVVNQLEAE